MRLIQFGPSEIRLSQIRPMQRRLRQIRIGEIRLVQVRPNQTRLHQTRAFKVRGPQLRPHPKRLDRPRLPRVRLLLRLRRLKHHILNPHDAILQRRIAPKHRLIQPAIPEIHPRVGAESVLPQVPRRVARRDTRGD